MHKKSLANILNQIRLLEASHVYGGACFFIFGILYKVVLDSNYLLTSNTFFGALTFFNLYLCKRSAKPILSNTFLLVVYIGLINVALHVGVSDYPLIFWGISTSIASAFIHGALGTTFWGAMGLLYFPLIYILRSYNLSASEFIPLSRIQNIFFICATYIGLLGFFIYCVLLHKNKLNSTVKLLTKSQKEMDTLLRVLCHDIANPVSKIALMSKMLNEDERQKYGKYLDSGVSRITRIIDNVREYMTAGNEPNQFNETLVSIEEAIRVAINHLSHKLEAKNISCNLSSAGDACYCLFNKDILVNQVLVNLLDNAIKFSKEDGQIDITVTQTSSEKFMVTITDHGVGIPEHRIENLFDAYSPTTTKGTHGEKGSGFGLPIVKAYVDAHKASISITSHTGANSGTEIKLEFQNA